jgi:hypothetical protein
MEDMNITYAVGPTGITEFVGFEVLSGGPEDFCILEYNAVTDLLHAGFLLGLFDPQDGGVIFFRNIGWLSTDYMAIYPRIYNFSIQNLQISQYSTLHSFGIRTNK